MKYFQYSTEMILFDHGELRDCENILVVGGDSWSNRIHMPEDNWVKVFAKEKKFDAVVVCADFADSNKNIFKNLVSFFSYNKPHYWQNKQGESWLETNRVSNKKVTAIVEWSSIIRDFSEETAWYRPFTWASQPDWDKLDETMYTEYINNIFQEKIYSHKTQLYSWQLQNYFKKWNIPYYFWMGFCDLVPESAKNTEFDIRNLLDKNRWFNLYDSPGNMLDYLDFLEKGTIPKKIPTILTEGSVQGFYKGVDYIKNIFTKVKDSTAQAGGYFHCDMHPNEIGHRKIAEILLERV